MRLALPGSALVHAGVLGVMLAGFAWPEAEDAAAPAAVTVTIVPMATIASNATEIVESDSTVSSVSAGSAVTTVAPLPSETLAPIAEPVQPIKAEPTPAAEPHGVEPVESQPVATLEVAELASTAPSPMAVAPLAVATPVSPSPPIEAAPPAAIPTLEPVATEELTTAPVPRTLSFERPTRPIVQAPQPRPGQPKPPAPHTAGNNGNSDADSVAAAASAAPQQASNGSGGEAEVARYPSQIIGQLRRALRRAGGQPGEVLVRFTVLASGQLAGVSVARSSGNGAVDEAGLAAVRRAAPFPPIPPAAGRADWTFDVPLAFGG